MRASVGRRSAAGSAEPPRACPRSLLQSYEKSLAHARAREALNRYLTQYVVGEISTLNMSAPSGQKSNKPDQILQKANDYPLSYHQGAFSVIPTAVEIFRAVRLNSSMTATRSPLNNRVVRSTPGEAEGRTTPLKGSPYTAAGALQSAFVVFLLPQVLRTLRLLSEDAFSVISTAQVGNIPT